MLAELLPDRATSPQSGLLDNLEFNVELKNPL
jgi:hypothetical protein